jgi:hypothetical protein
MDLWVTNHPTRLIGLNLGAFELRLDQCNYVRVHRDEPDQNTGNHPQGDEGHVHHHYGKWRAIDWLFEGANVNSIAHAHATVLEQMLVQQIVTSIEGYDRSGATLEEAIGEAARGCTHVECVTSVHRDAKLLKRVGQFFAAT